MLAVPENWDHQSGRGGHRNRNIDVVSLHHVGSIDDSVNDWVLLDGGNCSLNEERHETKLNAVFVNELFLMSLR
jgi:hypothetical protein